MNNPKYDITRYLCAAAEIAPKFRNKVFEQIIDNTIRYVAPSYGVDVPLVARHCIRGQVRDLVVEALLSVVLLWTLFSSFKSYGVFSGIFHFVLTLFTYPWLVAVLLRWSNLYLGYKIIAKDLKEKDKEDESNSLIEAQYEKRIKELEELQDGNVVYYSGYNPFVGSGKQVDGWSFVCGTKLKEELGLEPENLSLYVLYALINRNMTSLKIPNLTVQDKLFVNGMEIREDSRFLPNIYQSPVSSVAEALVDEYKEECEGNIRYYQTVQVVGWQGNIVFSSFFRITKNEKHLFVEANYYAVPPLKAQFYEIDQLSSTIPFGLVMKMGATSILPAILQLPLSPLRAVRYGRAFFKGRKDKKEILKQIDMNQKFNYGAYESIREMAARKNMQYFFQKTDLNMYKKQIERCFTDSIIEYLEGIGVDTSEFIQRKESIINQGIMINGGQINGDVVSVGSLKNNFINQVKDTFQNSNV
ncbi:hypothetical protein QW71_32575 [Paenibacillus sp. IHB B 3415]|uniref:hypothetical protein n=1 Tax=Paenibacillus sp. IHB B 3415 TaxID=867080 RepID=UPI0005753DA8|nr:hypothetical protein [Paenibacillus sp. IHB B 3415]KHL91837.1 hypothetical protein QW71_32575 [Paenibacillus sp. IHB B 3415]